MTSDMFEPHDPNPDQDAKEARGAGLTRTAETNRVARFLVQLELAPSTVIDEAKFQENLTLSAVVFSRGASRGPMPAVTVKPEA
jgi:hypothetical protein